MRRDGRRPYGGRVLRLAAIVAVAAGVAVAPVTKWELYDTAYTERYLGNPAIDPKPYQSSDALDEAVNIRDPLLLVHGMSDDNVVFQNSTELYARLQQAKRPFEMMAYPGATHAIAGEGPQTHVWTTISRPPTSRTVPTFPPFSTHESGATLSATMLRMPRTTSSRVGGGV